MFNTASEGPDKSKPKSEAAPVNPAEQLNLDTQKQAVTATAGTQIEQEKAKLETVKDLSALKEAVKNTDKAKKIDEFEKSLDYYLTTTIYLFLKFFS